MNLKIYYKNLSSRIASKWTILAIDICLVMISMLLACILQLGVSSIIYKMSLYVWMIFFSLFCMDEKGIFLVKGAMDKVAELMGVSRVTIYSYLDEARGKKG